MVVSKVEFAKAMEELNESFAALVARVVALEEKVNSQQSSSRKAANKDD